MDVKQFENRRWSNEDQVLQFRHKVTLGMITEGTVLDLGSGDGLLLSLLAQKGVTGKGLDLSEEGVAKARLKGLDTVVYDFGSQKLPFADSSFDTVVMLDILEHLYDPESVLKEAVRVARRAVVVGVPNFNSLPARLQTLLGRVPENNHPKKGHVFWFNLSVLRAMCRASGLTIKTLASNTIFESVPGLSMITKLAAKVMPGLFSLSFVALMTKDR